MTFKRKNSKKNLLQKHEKTNHENSENDRINENFSYIFFFINDL